MSGREDEKVTQLLYWQMDSGWTEIRQQRAESNSLLHSAASQLHVCAETVKYFPVIYQCVSPNCLFNLGGRQLMQQLPFTTLPRIDLLTLQL